MELKERLIQARKEHGLSQNDLAEKLSVSRQAISRWEQGTAVPSSDNLILLGKLYGISLDELVHGADAPETPKKETKFRLGRRGRLALLAAAAAAIILLLVLLLLPKEDGPIPLEDLKSGTFDLSSAEHFTIHYY